MNKGIVVLGLLVAVMSVNAFGGGVIGPPTAGLNKGQWSVGYNYMYSDMDWGKATISGTESEYTDGVLDADSPELYSYKLKIDDVKTQRHYATFGYGVEDNWEVYFQLGAADVKARVRDTDYPDDYSAGLNFDNDFAWGWGTKVTFCEQDNISWGASLQMNWLDTSWDTKGTYSDEIETVTESAGLDLETWDLLIAVGPTVDMGGWKLYGGPFYYHMSADLDVKYTEIGTDGVTVFEEIGKESGELNVDNFGAYIGAEFDLSASTNLTTEFGFTEDGWALGTGITWKF